MTSWTSKGSRRSSKLLCFSIPGDEDSDGQYLALARICCLVSSVLCANKLSLRLPPSLDAASFLRSCALSIPSDTDVSPTSLTSNSCGAQDGLLKLPPAFKTSKEGTFLSLHALSSESRSECEMVSPAKCESAS